MLFSTYQVINTTFGVVSLFTLVFVLTPGVTMILVWAPNTLSFWLAIMFFAIWKAIFSCKWEKLFSSFESCGIYCSYTLKRWNRAHWNSVCIIFLVVELSMLDKKGLFVLHNNLKLLRCHTKNKSLCSGYLPGILLGCRANFHWSKVERFLYILWLCQKFNWGST